MLLIVSLVIAVIVFIALWDREREATSPPTAAVAGAEERVADESGALPGGPSAPPPPPTPEPGPTTRDHAILEETMRAARADRPDTPPIRDLLRPPRRPRPGEPALAGTPARPG